MKKHPEYFIPLIFLAILLLTSCQTLAYRHYEEIPSMLNVLTNKAQSAFEQGYFEKDEQAVRDYIGKKNPEVLGWFDNNNYELKIGVVGGYSVVMVCDKGRPIFEDTYCNPGYPDKDHRGNQNLRSCEITMTVEEVERFCK